MADATLAGARRPRPAVTRDSRAGTRRRIGFVLLHVVMIIGALIMFFPFLWTIVTSISPGAGLTLAPALFPDHPSLAAYQQLFSERPFGQVILNSLLLALSLIHISEPTRRTPISYAVFCLKK